MQYLDSLVARAVNASLGRFEGFWANDASYSAVTPIDSGDVVAKVAYVLANPVASGLVRIGDEWPGLRSAPKQVGIARLVARRPKVFFAANGCMPEQVELELTAPPGFASGAEYSALVSSSVAELEARHRSENASRGFLGAARVLAQKPFARPAPGAPRFRLNPRIAARDKWKRIEAISSLKTFLRDYRDAWNARRAGVAHVLFPAGTYLLKVFHNVPCAAAP
jgi:hypothetical protein